MVLSHVGHNCYELHYITFLNIKITSGLSILIYGIISLREAR